jgi:hypothetical protein
MKKLILYLAFFCNITRLSSCSRDENDASKVQIRIRVFLLSKITAVTAQVKLLPPSHGFLSGSWQRYEGGLSGHELYEECVQTKTAGDNNWMPLFKIGEFNARQKGGSDKKVCCDKFGISSNHRREMQS